MSKDKFDADEKRMFFLLRDVLSRCVIESVFWGITIKSSAKDLNDFLDYFHKEHFEE